jgi:hypothetical protein
LGESEPPEASVNHRILLGLLAAMMIPAAMTGCPGYDVTEKPPEGQAGSGGKGGEGGQGGQGGQGGEAGQGGQGGQGGSTGDGGAGGQGGQGGGGGCTQDLNCDDGLKCCNGECVNSNLDPLHCGTCENHCPSVSPFCKDGKCNVLPSCTAVNCRGLERCCGASCCAGLSVCCYDADTKQMQCKTQCN